MWVQGRVGPIWEAGLGQTGHEFICSHVLPVGHLERADAGTGVSGTVTMKKCLLCAEQGPRHVPRALRRQHLNKPSVEAAEDAVSTNPPLTEGRGASEKGGTHPASRVPEARAGLPPRPGQKQGLLGMQVPGPPPT